MGQSLVTPATWAHQPVPAAAPALRGRNGSFRRSARHLFEAVEADDLTALSQCLEDGVHVESRDDEGRTPLMLAVLRGHERVYEALRAAGASLDVRDGRGVPMLTYLDNFGALPRQAVLTLQAAMTKAMLDALVEQEASGTAGTA